MFMDLRKFVYKPGQTLGETNHSPDAVPEGFNEEQARSRLTDLSDEIAKYQDLQMAYERHGLLILFQGMDGAGKDSAIKEVMSTLDPQGCEMKMFKKAVGKELRHGFLRRAASSAPARGQIGIFNRSYYEHVIGERVHPETLEEYGLARELTGSGMWEKRFGHINNFEAYLADEGIHVLKFYLHLSKDKQREKLLERIERPEKKWKFSSSDIKERELWDRYIEVYEEAFDNTSTAVAPWHIIPNNDRWFARVAVAEVVLEKLRSFHSRYPTLDKEKAEELAEAKQKLEKEG